MQTIQPQEQVPERNYEDDGFENDSDPDDPDDPNMENVQQRILRDEEENEENQGNLQVAPNDRVNLARPREHPLLAEAKRRGILKRDYIADLLYQDGD